MKKMIVHHWAIRLFMPAIFGAIAYLLILLILMYDSVINLEEVYARQELLFSMAIAYLFSEGQHWGIRLVNAVLPKNTPIGGRIAMQVVVSMTITFGVVTGAVTFYFEQYLNTQVYQTEMIVFRQIWTIITALYLMLYFSALLHSRRNESKLAQEMQERQQLDFKVQSFNQEVNPELLYGSLETLISQIHDNHHEADAYVNRLSSVYRYILDGRHEDLISVSDEIAAAYNMVGLLNPMSQGHITLENQLEGDLPDYQLVPGTLPTLIEHTVRTNIVSAVLPLKIILRKEEDYLVVENRLCQRLQPMEEDERLTGLQEAYLYYTTPPWYR